jgi:predicted NUDIX family phosphoesterase
MHMPRAKKTAPAEPAPERYIPLIERAPDPRPPLTAGDLRQVVCLSQVAFDPIRRQGAHNVGLPALADTLERDRVDVTRHIAETSPGYKQIVTYGYVLRDDKVLAYRRRADHGRADLAGVWSLGIGGHVEPADLPGGVDVLESLRLAALREVTEELPGVKIHSLSLVGVLNRDEGSGVYHAGVVFVALVSGEVEPVGELAEVRWVEPVDLAALDGLEPWSQSLAESWTAFF